MICDSEDFALVTALYRSSIDGRRFMYEAILAEDDFDIPNNFTSRTAEVLEVYLKSLGVRMVTIDDDNREYIGEEDDDEIVMHKVKNRLIFASNKEMYYLKKLSKVYRRILKDKENVIIDDTDEIWNKVLENLTFNKKHLTEDIITIFKRNIEVFG